MQHLRSSMLSTVSLQSLRHFEAVIRLGTFDRAARELNVAASTVKQHIKRLEQSLGVTLFKRHGNRSVPNANAVQVTAVLAQAFADIEAALKHCVNAPRTTSVRFEVHQAWANRWLIPRLGSFTQLFPDVSVEFLTGFRDADVRETDVDLMLSMVPGHQLDPLNVPLITPRLGLICSPDLAAHIASVTDIFHLPWIASEKSKNNWARWVEAVQTIPGKEKPLKMLSTSTLVYEATLAGSGVAIAEIELVLNDLESGRLVQPLPFVVEAESRLCLVDLTRASQRKTSERFQLWLQSEANLLRQRTDDYLRGSE